MAYGKYKRRNYTRKRRGGVPWYKRKYNAMQLASKAWSAAKYIKTLVNVERKFNDTTATQALSTTPYIALLTGVPQGNDYNQRAGLSIKSNSMLLRYQVVCNPAMTTTFGQTVRIVLVCDMDNQGSSPAWTDVFESASVISPMNHVNGSRFKILHDKCHNVSPGATDALVFRSRYLKLGEHARFSSTTYNSTKEGHLYFLAMSDTATAANMPTLNYYARYRYIDN